jgi:hypothetical protein
MLDDTKDTSVHRPGRRFVKGVHRAVFSADAPTSEAAPQPPPVVTPPKEEVQLAPVQTHEAKKRSPKTIIFFLLFALLGSLAALTFQMYWQSHQTIAKLEQAAPQVLMDLQTKEIVDRVRRHMVLPDEEPLVNTVTDADNVRGEPFYANAQNGDKVIVFSRRAILYSPTLDKIVEVGFIRPVTPTPLVGEASPSADVAGLSSPSGHVLLQMEKK